MERWLDNKGGSKEEIKTVRERTEEEEEQQLGVPVVVLCCCYQGKTGLKSIDFHSTTFILYFQQYHNTNEGLAEL